MAGYYGYSMSNNAKECYDFGIMPKSKWTKSAILEAIAEIDETKAELFSKLKKYQLDTLLTYDSWHHTSNHYNETDFYKLDVDKLEEVTFDQLKLIEKEVEKKTIENGIWCAEVQIWGGTRKHPKVIGTEIVKGKRRGDWITTESGKRYSLYANKTLRFWEEK